MKLKWSIILIFLITISAHAHRISAPFQLTFSNLKKTPIKIDFSYDPLHQGLHCKKINGNGEVWATHLDYNDHNKKIYLPFSLYDNVLIVQNKFINQAQHYVIGEAGDYFILAASSNDPITISCLLDVPDKKRNHKMKLISSETNATITNTVPTKSSKKINKK